MDAKPRKVALYQTPFPEGFHLRNYTIALYGNGQEVATNLSDTKMELTRDEAYQYIFVDYLSTHKGQTRPPAAVLMAPRAELKRLPASELSQSVYVHVDKEGHVIKVSTDESGKHDAGSNIASALQYFRFIPALDKGVAVNGRAKLTVAEFVQ